MKGQAALHIVEESARSVAFRVASVNSRARVCTEGENVSVFHVVQLQNVPAYSIGEEIEIVIHVFLELHTDYNEVGTETATHVFEEGCNVGHTVGETVIVSVILAFQDLCNDEYIVAENEFGIVFLDALYNAYDTEGEKVSFLVQHTTVENVFDIAEGNENVFCFLYEILYTHVPVKAENVI